MAFKKLPKICRKLQFRVFPRSADRIFSAPDRIIAVASRTFSAQDRIAAAVSGRFGMQDQIAAAVSIVFRAWAA